VKRESESDDGFYQLRRSAGKCRTMYMVADNDTVLISVWHGRGMHSAGCSLEFLDVHVASIGSR